MAKTKTEPAPSARMSEEAEYQSVIPDLGTSADPLPLPTMPGNVPFLLTAHHARWTVIGGEIVPLFGIMPLRAGYNGMVERAGGKGLNPADARQDLIDGGWKIIPVDKVPPHHVRPGERPSYLRSPKGRPDVTLLTYERCFPGSPNTAPDVPRYLEFCRHLVDSGVISPPPVYVLEQMLERAEKARDEVADKARYNSNLKSAADRLSKDVEAISKALAKRRSQVEATPYEEGASVVPDLGGE